MSKIIIQRTREYNNSLRDYIIFLDGIKVGTIANGQIKEFSLNPGGHTLYSKIDWCSSPTMPFEISASETKHFKIGGFKNGNWIMPLTLGIIIISFIVKRTFGITYLFYFAIPLFLILIYFITIGRRNYLTLKEV